MRRRLVAAAVFSAASLLYAQSGRPQLKPQVGDEAAQGAALYRSNCAFCHGLTGLGGRGPNLVAGEAKSDDALKRIVKEGVPGSTMPAFWGFSDEQLDRLVAFIHQLRGAGGPAETVKGDPAKGKAIYAKNGCAGCHMIDGQGSIYGPDLTRIGTSRSADYLHESIVEPSKDIPTDYEGLTVSKGGSRTSGIRLNEDTFAVVLRTPSQAVRSFTKDETTKVEYAKQSMMPAYKQIPPAELDDLIAYLKTLRGKTSNSAVKEAEGIR